MKREKKSFGNFHHNSSKANLEKQAVINIANKIFSDLVRVLGYIPSHEEKVRITKNIGESFELAERIGVSGCILDLGIAVFGIDRSNLTAHLLLTCGGAA